MFTNMEAQQIITMSINKITGSRGQRGGVNLRKNLLVATVLHSARAMYYEEMCNRMTRNAELQSRERDTSREAEEDDCTEAPDWGDYSISDEKSSVEQSCERVKAEVTQPQPMEDKENCRPTQPTDSSSLQAMLEKPELNNTRLVVESKPDSSSDKERSVLGQKSTNSPSSTFGCNVCKRKRSDSAEELREACESILPKRAKSSDSECQPEDQPSTTTPSAKQNSEGSITSLVSIFKSGFHGLSGDANPNGGSTNHLQQSSYASSMPRPFEQLQMPIAAC